MTKKKLLYDELKKQFENVIIVEDEDMIYCYITKEDGKGYKCIVEENIQPNILKGVMDLPMDTFLTEQVSNYIFNRQDEFRKYLSLTGEFLDRNLDCIALFLGLSDEDFFCELLIKYLENGIIREDLIYYFMKENKNNIIKLCKENNFEDYYNIIIETKEQYFVLSILDKI